MAVRLKCPAKINLFLEVTGRRPDGYRLLETIFAKIALYDELTLRRSPGKQISLAVLNGRGMPPLSAGKDNLVYRAADAFLRTFKIGAGVDIKLKKVIPMGAGLGGGSSDAAGTLKGLAKLFGIKVTDKTGKRLHNIGKRLGADVPFFLRPEPLCKGTGIGDRLKPLRTVNLPYIILIYPNVHSSTAEAYSRLKDPSSGELLTSRSNFDKIQKKLGGACPISQWDGLLFNRLEDAVLSVHPEISRAKSVLSELGARGVLMSGSGSSVFGFVASRAEGQRLVRRLRKEPWRVFLIRGATS